MTARTHGMTLRIDSGPIDATDRLHEVPRAKWHDLMLARRRFLEIHISRDCRCLVEFVNDAKLMFEALGFRSVEQMIRDGYGLKPEEINVAVEWLQLNPPAQPIALDVAVTLGKQGRPKKGEEKVGNANISKGGTTAAYILARLDRDGHTELAAKVRAGKLSANAAAIEAGFRKQLTPLDRIVRLLPLLTPVERSKLRELLDAPPGQPALADAKAVA